ncbi:peptide chain release factor N(5)-glutamine methyltransferase [Sphingomonas sp. AX6]|uniref:peptide chain release factor N(5)-glutamine methyltransferase n=1 Tax=Sphingomonas sp. AX6 TaxID=2653171 RepID=UPI001F3C605B|nr:peptide chain release factor N(5)-glutamine methyltransferase [Sphingomonas sp. AX6]
MSIAAVLSEAAAQLSAISDTPRLDAELLLAHALGCSREAMLLGKLDEPVPPAFHALFARRMAHEPVAYITGTRAFWTIDLAVGPGVLIPRADSETLIEAAVAYFGDRTPATILDLGTGPGTLLLAALAEWSDAMGLGVDSSEAALDYARRNGDRIASDRAKFRLGDWGVGIDARFDLVLCNPPYVEADAILDAQVAAYEPGSALYAGADGLDDYRRIAPQLPGLVAPGGVAILEMGHTQRESVTALLEVHGATVACRRDLGGRPRALIATYG